MPGSAASRVYAETLLELAREAGSLDRVAADVLALVRTLAASELPRRFLESPRVGGTAKKAALRRALEGRISDLTLRFLEIVIDRERQDLLGEILNEFGARLGDLRNQAVLEVASAVPLDEATSGRLRDTFAGATGCEVVLRARVDPSLLGGIVVQVGDVRLDGSVRTRLSNLRERMLRSTRAMADARPRTPR